MATYRTDHGYAVARTLTYGRRLGLAGNTYAERDWIRSLGGVWHKDQREWRIPVPSNMAARADLLYQLSKRGLQWRKV